MNAEELKKAKAICEAATEGKWEEHGYLVTSSTYDEKGVITDITRICELPEDADKYELEDGIYNCQFIAFARTALPAALDEIERLQKENAIMSEALEKLSRLGAGDRLGNSDGNCIAQRALKEAKVDK